MALIDGTQLEKRGTPCMSELRETETRPPEGENMNFWIALLALVVFVVFLTRNDWHKFRRPKVEPAIRDMLVEHQARIDMHMAATRLLLRTHPNREEAAALLREAATRLRGNSVREFPDTHAVYDQGVDIALQALIGD
ncbi:hypothetical protein [Paraburkholderia sp. WP4_3_2]|nr:hypothetical protein [Paraburkholderia sp. WP4_3_2]